MRCPIVSQCSVSLSLESKQQFTGLRGFPKNLASPDPHEPPQGKLMS